jgi:hypothetical protein
MANLVKLCLSNYTYQHTPFHTFQRIYVLILDITEENLN